MTRRTSVKAGIHFSHYECFGHIARVIAIGQIFKRKFPQGNFFFIQAGREQLKARLDQAGQVYSIPFPFVNRNNFRQPVCEGVIEVKARVQATLNIVERERPDLFFTEFFPLGREESRHELIPVLAKVSSHGAKICGVAGYPLLTGIGAGWRDKVLELYDKVIIFAPAIEKQMIADSFARQQERQRYNDFFKSYEQKIVFAGYLLPQGDTIYYKEDENLPRPKMPAGACHVAVVRGGGAYYPKIIASAIRASELLGKKYYFSIVAGPSTTLEEWYFFSTLLTKKKIKNVALLKSISDYEGLIRDSDLCVSTASYHSSVMLMKHAKKSIVIPFEGYGENMEFLEQPARAKMLRGVINAEILPIGELTTANLVQLIEDVAGKIAPNGFSAQAWFTGAEYLEKTLPELFLA